MEHKNENALGDAFGPRCSGVPSETDTASPSPTIAIADPWKHKDIWKRTTQQFTVEVSRHSEASSGYDNREGPHRWAVYAYIYPAHPHFHKFDGPGLWQEACSVLPGHSYTSYLKYHKDALNGEITSVQVGWDYHHDGDHMFTHDATREDARCQFRDASNVFDWLQSRIEVTQPPR